MARIDNLENFLVDIATSIRNKKGITEQIPAENFDTEIASIENNVKGHAFVFTSLDEANTKTDYDIGDKVFIFNTVTIPYNPNFTNTTLGGKLGFNRVYANDSFDLPEPIEFSYSTGSGSLNTYSVSIDMTSAEVIIGGVFRPITLSYISVDGLHYTLQAQPPMAMNITSALTSFANAVFEQNNILSYILYVRSLDTLRGVYEYMPTDKSTSINDMTYQIDLSSIKIDSKGLASGIKYLIKPVKFTDYSEYYNKITKPTSNCYYGIYDCKDYIYVIVDTTQHIMFSNGNAYIYINSASSSPNQVLKKYDKITKQELPVMTSMLGKYTIISEPLPLDCISICGYLTNSDFASVHGIWLYSYENEHLEQIFSGSTTIYTNTGFSLTKLSLGYTAKPSDILYNTTTYSDDLAIGTHICKTGPMTEEEYNSCLDLSNRIMGGEV